MTPTPHGPAAPDAPAEDPLAAAEAEFMAACAGGPLPPVAGIRAWLDRVPADARRDLLPGLVAVHLAAAWRSGAAPDLADYAREFGSDYPEFESPAAMPAEVLRADLLAR